MVDRVNLRLCLLFRRIGMIGIECAVRETSKKTAVLKYTTPVKVRPPAIRSYHTKIELQCIGERGNTFSTPRILTDDYGLFPA